MSAVNERKTKIEHEQRAERSQERPEKHACSCATCVVAGCAECVEPGDPHACAADRDTGERLLRQPCFRLALVNTATRRDVDECVGRPAVRRDERPVARRGIRSDPRGG